MPSRFERESVGGDGRDVTADWSPSGLQVTVQRPRPVWARVTGSSGALYAWAEVNTADTAFPDLVGSFAQAGGAAAAAWPAYEVTGSTSVPVGAKVLLWPSPAGTFWVFRYDGGGGSGLTVEEADGSPQYASVTTLRVDQADGAVLSQPSAGVARIDWASATAAQKGMVDTATQTFGGAKTFLTMPLTVGAPSFLLPPTGFLSQGTGGFGNYVFAEGSGGVTYLYADGQYDTLGGVAFPPASGGAAPHVASVSAWTYGGSDYVGLLVRGESDIIIAPGGAGGRVKVANDATFAVGTGQTGTVGFGAACVHGIVTALGTGLADPNADRVVFWDDSAGQYQWLAPDGAGVEVSGTTLRLKNQGTVSDLTDATGGTAGGTVADVGAAFSQATLNDNFATLAAKLNAVLDALQAAGVVTA